MAKKIINLRTERNETGLTISVQSDVKWDAVCSPRNSAFNLCGVPCRAFKSTLRDRVNETGKQHQVVINSPDPVLYNGNNINASFLQALDIEHGVSFVIPADSMTPITPKMMIDFEKRLGDWAEDLHNAFIEPIRTKVIITAHYKEV